MRTLMLAAAFASVAASQMAVAQPAPPTSRPTNSCFFVNQFQGWRAPDARTIIIRVNTSRYYRLGLSNECPELKWPQAHLVLNVRGPSTICSPVDWDLKVSTNPNGYSVGCIVKTMEQMTPEEVDALPRGFKP